MLHIRLTDDDKAVIQQAADRIGMSASAFMVGAARQVIRDGELRLPLAPTAWLAAELARDAGEPPAEILEPGDPGLDAFLDGLARDASSTAECPAATGCADHPEPRDAAAGAELGERRRHR